MKAVQITGWCARFIREQVQPGDTLYRCNHGKWE